MRIAPYRREMVHASSVRRRQRGFSLVELLIVMALIALIALAGAPWFTKVSQRSQMKSAAHELSLTLAAARMRAVKRNLPSTVTVIPRSGTQAWNIVETYENVVPTPIKVGETRISPQVEFPASGTVYPQDLSVTFGGDGRVQGIAPGELTVFTLRGLQKAGTQNDLPIAVEPNGKIEVYGPNPTLPSKPKGTGWH